MDAKQSPAGRDIPHPWGPRGWRRKFGCALRGLRLAVGEGPSFWPHLAAAGGVALVAWRLGVSGVEAAVLALAIGLVLAAEALNSALERMARAVTAEYDERVRDALDLASGAVLAAAAAAAAAGIAILGPRLGLPW